MKISAAIITFNEERNIERCIRSLQPVVDEILVVDSFSSDKTQQICEQLGVKFIQHVFEGHIQQKNYALDQTLHDWVLSLDADEALTPELQESILLLKNQGSSPEFNGYKFNRFTNYCGHWVKHCGWYPDTKVRLVNKHQARWRGVNPHDQLEFDEKQVAGFLKGDLLHYSYNTPADHYRQIEYFGNIAANELFLRGKRTNFFQIGVKVVAQFVKSYFLKLGFLDGITGFTISRRSAYATYVKYTKLWRLWKA